MAKKLTIVLDSGAPELLIESPYSRSISNGTLIVKTPEEKYWFPLNHIILAKEEDPESSELAEPPRTDFQRVVK